MNIAKNIEAIFVAAVVLCCAVSYAASDAPAVHAGFTANADIPTVTITAKRLTATEKAQFQEERE